MLRQEYQKTNQMTSHDDLEGLNVTINLVEDKLDAALVDVRRLNDRMQDLNAMHARIGWSVVTLGFMYLAGHCM